MKISRLLLTVFLCSPLFVFGGISGKYKIEGNDAQYGRYTGTAVIVKENSTYIAHYVYSDGGTLVATGLRKGDQLSFVYSAESGCGVQVYQMKGCTLKGPWADFGGGDTGYEKLTKIRHHS